MTRPLLASLAAGALALTLVTAPAEARPRGGAVAAGAIIGLAAGAIIGSALSNRHYDDHRYVTGPVPRRPYHRGYAAPGYYEAEPYAQPYGGYRTVRRAHGYPPGYTIYE